MRVFKIAGITAGSVLALVMLAVLALPLIVDPNAYRPRLERAVREATGRDLALSGRIKLSVLPRVALEFGPASLGNPQGFQPGAFATLRHATLQVRLLPLLHKRIEFRRIEIDGLDVRLARDSDGEANWERWEANTLGSNHPARASANARGELGLPAVDGLTLRDARLSYESMVGEHINVTVGTVRSGQPIAIDARFGLLRGPGAPALEVSSRFDLTASAPAGVRIDNLEARLDDAVLHGRAALSTTNALTFDLTLDRLNLDRYLSTPARLSAALGAQPSGGPESILVSPPPTAPAPELLPVDLLRTLHLSGVLAIGQLRVSGMTLSDVRAGIAARDGITRIAPATATLYGGHYSGELQVDVRGPTPSSALDQRMMDIDVAALLRDLLHSAELAGRGNITSHLTTRGVTRDAMLGSLSGHIALNVSQGAIRGIDFRAEIHRAMAVFGMKGDGSHEATADGGTGDARTRFDSFAMSADVTDGVAVTRDLDVASRRLSLTGAGSANFVTDTLDYRVRAAILGAAVPGAQAPNTLIALPLDITGTLTSPKVRPDLNAMAQELPVEHLERQGRALSRKLLEKLKGLLR